ncbi:MAG: aminopeptidase P family protein [Clostridia bacterium]|nr:aminopeptidase P family protein [Clostridia bacterium]
MFRKRIDKLINTNKASGYYITSPENLYYFSGFTGGEGVVFISTEHRLLFTDSRYTIQAKEESKDFEIIDIAEKKFSDFLKEENIKSVGLEEDFVTLDRYDLLKKITDKTEWIFISNEISDIRKIKDEYELSCIKTAARLADDAFSYVLPKISTGKTEREIALLLEFFMKENGADGLSFETIAASGARSALPHGAATDKKIQKNEFLTLDFGCKYKGYSSDMTRTVVIGKATDVMKEIYETVLLAQNTALSKIKSGVLASSVDEVAREIIKKAGYGDNFGHGLGHSLGLNVHEPPSLSPRCNEILRANELMTVEPGIYIENFGGVRIEDLVVIKDNGYVNLVSSPKELIEL